MIKWFKVQVYAFGSSKINQRGVIAGSEHSGIFYQSGTGDGKRNGAKAEKTECSVYGNLCANITCA